MRYLLSVDPGKSSGLTLWTVPDTERAERIGAWQVEGGLAGFLGWVDRWICFPDESDIWPTDVPEVEIPGAGIATVPFLCLSERFTPLQNQGFSLTSDAVEPLRIEGAMIALGMIPHYDEAPDQWQRPAQMYLYGGTNLADRKKRARAWLKERDLLLTGKDVGCKDAHDAVSSTLHALAWLRSHHEPTRAHFWGGE